MSDGITDCRREEENKAAKLVEKKCGMKTEVYSRVCGYYRPVENWNRGKKEEFKERKNYTVENREGKGE